MKKSILTLVLFLNTIALCAQCYDAANMYSFTYDGHSYRVIKENKSWTEAAECAVLDNGFLVEINDEAEQDALLSELTSNAGIAESNTTNQFGTAAVWIGGSDAQEEGTWIWDGDNDDIGPQFWLGGVNGNPVGGSYSNWGTIPPEPDNSGGNQHKLTLTIDSDHPNFSKWNDLADNANNTLYYVIEYATILSNQDIFLKEHIEVYPNPSSDFVIIETELDIRTIEVLNGLGQVVLSTMTNKQLTELNISHLEKGLYFLKVRLESGESVSFRIVK
ncbi:MAG: T9SS type A sorting domain-containing protein [Bacteroidota bacterium]